MNNEKKPYNEIPKDTNGEWVESEGWYVAHNGERVPLQGINKNGSENVYFKGKTVKKHIEKEIKGKYKILYYLSEFCILAIIATFFIGIVFQSISPETMFLVAGILYTLIVIFAFIMLRKKY